MPSYKVPGVYYEETVNQAAVITGTNLSAAAFLGSNPRGPVVPTYINSWSQYLQLFGGFVSGYLLPHAVFQYFSNGGREAYVCRVAGSGAAAATKTLNDRAGTPLPTLRVDATNPGAWGNTMYIDITDAGTDRFNLVVRLGGTSDAYIVERWTDLSMNDTDARYVENVINSQQAGSNYIKVTDLDSNLATPTPTAAPADRPALQTATALATGTDGAAITDTDVVGSGTPGGALLLFDQIDQPLSLNIPGVSAAASVNLATAYASGRGDMFVVIDPPVGQSASQMATYAATLTATSFGALYYPWIYVADPAGGTGSTRLIPPGGAVLGQYAATDTSRGVYKTPAGLGTRLGGAISTELQLTQNDLGTLNAAGVNAIRQIVGAGVVVMGGRTLKPNGSDKFISIRRSLIYIRSSLVTSTRFAIFEPNDSVLWNTLQAVIGRFLLDFWASGGLRGNTPGDAFYVKCNDENNTGSSIAAGEVHIEIGVALQYPAEFLVIKLTQREVGAAVTVAA